MYFVQVGGVGLNLQQVDCIMALKVKYYFLFSQAELYTEAVALSKTLKKTKTKGC